MRVWVCICVLFFTFVIFQSENYTIIFLLFHLLTPSHKYYIHTYIHRLFIMPQIFHEKSTERDEGKFLVYDITWNIYSYLCIFLNNSKYKKRKSRENIRQWWINNEGRCMLFVTNHALECQNVSRECRYISWMVGYEYK